MAPDERALLNAIIAQPEEDTPRLVYADWLQEHDRPERAEYIRLSIELANLRYGDPDFENRQEQLRERLQRFDKLAHDTWPRELSKRCPPNRDLSFIFRRGFASRAHCSVGYFLANADAIFREAPISDFCPRTLNRAAAKRLVNSPQYGRLKAISFWDPGDALALLECRSVKISVLDFSRPIQYDAGYWDDVATAFATHTGLASVARIDFQNCGLGNLAGACLADARFIEPEVLNLLGNNFEDRVRQSLRARFGPRVWLEEADRAGTLRGDSF